MKLKKLISIAGTLAIVLSMITMPVKAADTHWELDISKVTRYEKASGLAGKAADDASMQYPETSGDRYMQLDYASWYSDSSFALKTPASDMTGYNGYMTISYNVMAPNETNSVAITTNGGPVAAGNNAGGSIAMTSANGFVRGRWNRVVHIITLTSGTSVAYTYVNGVLKGTRTYSLYSSGKTAIRLSARDSGLIYFDDVTVDFTDSAPDTAAYLAMPTLSDIQSKAVVNNSANTIGICGKTTVSEIASANSSLTVRAYSNSTFSSQLGSTDALAEGNTVVAEDSQGRIVYYSVTEEDLVWSLNNADVVETAYIDHDASDSRGAKTGDGTALLFQAVGNDTDETYRRLNSVGEVTSPLTMPLSNMTQYEGYMIVSMNVYSDVETQKIAITTNSGLVVMGGDGFINVNKKYGAMDKGRWHHVVSAIRLKDGERTATTYIDGKQKFQRNHYLYSSASYTDVRLTTSKNARGDVYFDDVKITFTNSLPDMDTLSALPQPANNFSSAANIYGDQFVILSGQTVDSTSLSITDGTVTVYTDDTLTATVSSGDLSEGNVIVIENSEDTMAYYTVFLEDDVDLTPYVKENGSTLANFRTGTMCFGRKLILDEEKELLVVAAQYTSDESQLIKFSSATGTYSGVSDINVDSAITETAGTKVKLFIWENDGYLSVCGQAEFTP